MSPPRVEPSDARMLILAGLRVAVVRKGIKNLHLGVYPPDGRVRIAVPPAVSDAAVRVAVIGKLRWIRRQQAAFAGQARDSKREMVNGESHYYQGRRYRLEVVEAEGRSGVRIRRASTMTLDVPAGATTEQRERVLQRWYRERLQEQIPPLVRKWERKLGVRLTAWGIKRMKTKWGSCNAEAGRIWLNLELAKKSPECLEYIVAHELAHLRVRHHDERFNALMDRHLPRWRAIRTALNKAPLANERWT